MLLPFLDGLLTVPPALDPAQLVGRAAAIPGLPEYRLLADNPYFVGEHEAPRSWLETIWLLRLFPDAPPGRPWTRDGRRIDYGNVLEDIVDPWVIWNGHASNRAYSALTAIGSTEGVRVTEPHEDPPSPPPGPPPGPMPPDDLPAPGTLLPGAQLRFDIEILLAGIPFFDIVFSWAFPGGLALRVLGARAVVFPELPDWTEGVELDHLVADDIFASDRRLEQRTSAFEDEEMHLWRIQYRKDGRDEWNRLWNRLHRAAHRRSIVPFYVDLWSAAADAAGALVVAVTGLPLNLHLFRSDLVLRLDRARPEWFELRRAVDVDPVAQTVTVDAAWTESFPVGRQVFAFGMVATSVRIDRENRTDAAQLINVAWSEA